MKRLNNQQSAQRSDLVAQLRAAHESLEKGLTTFNQVWRKQWAAVEALADTYNSAVRDANTFIDEMGSEARDAFDSRSERWQESDTGVAVEDWIAEWENAAIGEIELEEPEDVELDDDAPDQLDELPEEANV